MLVYNYGFISRGFVRIGDGFIGKFRGLMMMRMIMVTILMLSLRMMVMIGNMIEDKFYGYSWNLMEIVIFLILSYPLFICIP